MRVNCILRRRLGRWADELAGGAALGDAARSARLPPLLAEMLAPATSGDAAADVMDFLSRYYANRFSRAALLLQNAAIPAMVFVFGFFVAAIALSIVAPMAALIDHMS